MAGAGSHLIATPNLACVAWLAGWFGLFAGLQLRRGETLVILSITTLAGALVILLGHSPEPFGAVLLASAIGLFAAEAAWRLRFAAGAAGTAVLLYWLVSAAPSRSLAGVAAGLPGAALTYVAARAGAAHRQKAAGARLQTTSHAASPKIHSYRHAGRG